jgi:hypothetical protein
MSDPVWLLESPIYQVEGATITYTVTFEGVTTVSSPALVVWKNGTDYSSTAAPSGSTTASLNVVTLKPILAVATDGGQKYICTVTASDGTNTQVRKFEIVVVDAAEEQ